jgi:hypothetical protein
LPLAYYEERGLQREEEDGTILAETGNGAGSRLRDDPPVENDVSRAAALAEGAITEFEAQDDPIAENAALGLLEPQDRVDRLGTGIRNPNIQRITSQLPASSSRQYENTADGILLAWKACAYASTEAGFRHAWTALMEEFPDQEGKVKIFRVDRKLTRFYSRYHLPPEYLPSLSSRLR